MSKVFENVYILETNRVYRYTQRSQSGAMHFERVLNHGEIERKRQREQEEYVALAFYVTISFMCQATRYDADATMYSTQKMNFKHVCGALHCVNGVADSNEHDLHFLTFKHVHSLLILCSFSYITLQIENEKKKEPTTHKNTPSAASHHFTRNTRAMCT